MSSAAGASDASPRVLMLSPHASIGGIAQIVVSTAAHLRARGWHVDVAFPPLNDGGTFERWVTEQGVSLTTSEAIGRPSQSKRWRDVPALRRFVRGFRPDVVNYHTGHTISLKAALALRTAGAPFVVSPHDPYPSSPMVRRQSMLAGRIATRLVANSTATRDMLADVGIPPRKVDLIHCGVEVPEVLPDRAEARRELGVDTDVFLIAGAARLDRRKGFHELIEAVAQLPEDGPPVELLIGGDGPERERLTAQVRDRLGDRGRLTGRLPTLHTLYAAADLFVLPSRFEGFGLVFIEAALHSVPSIGYRIGGVPDAILDGETGLLVAPGDIASLTAAMQRLRLDDGERARLGTRAGERARHELTAAQMADRYGRLFSEVTRSS